MAFIELNSYRYVSRREEAVSEPMEPGVHFLGFETNNQGATYVG